MITFWKAEPTPSVVHDRAVLRYQRPNGVSGAQEKQGLICRPSCIGSQQVAPQVVRPLVSFSLLLPRQWGYHLRGDWSVRRQVKRQHVGPSAFVTLTCRFGAERAILAASHFSRLYTRRSSHMCERSSDAPIV